MYTAGMHTITAAPLSHIQFPVTTHTTDIIRMRTLISGLLKRIHAGS